MWPNNPGRFFSWRKEDLKLLQLTQTLSLTSYLPCCCYLGSNTVMWPLWVKKQQLELATNTPHNHIFLTLLHTLLAAQIYLWLIEIPIQVPLPLIPVLPHRVCKHLRFPGPLFLSLPHRVCKNLEVSWPSVPPPAPQSVPTLEASWPSVPILNPQSVQTPEVS